MEHQIVDSQLWDKFHRKKHPLKHYIWQRRYRNSPVMFKEPNAIRYAIKKYMNDIPWFRYFDDTYGRKFARYKNNIYRTSNVYWDDQYIDHNRVKHLFKNYLGFPPLRSYLLTGRVPTKVVKHVCVSKSEWLEEELFRRELMVMYDESLWKADHMRKWHRSGYRSQPQRVYITIDNKLHYLASWSADRPHKIRETIEWCKRHRSIFDPNSPDYLSEHVRTVIINKKNRLGRGKFDFKKEKEWALAHEHKYFFRRRNVFKQPHPLDLEAWQGRVRHRRLKAAMIKYEKPFEYKSDEELRALNIIE